MSPENVRAAYERIRAEVGPNVTVVAATKYVSLEEMAVLAEAGVEVVGETGHRTSSASTPSTATPFGGTSSGTSSPTRRRS